MVVHLLAMIEYRLQGRAMLFAEYSLKANQTNAPTSYIQVQSANLEQFLEDVICFRPRLSTLIMLTPILFYTPIQLLRGLMVSRQSSAFFPRLLCLINHNESYEMSKARHLSRCHAWKTNN